jgi:hypothetical protein
MCKWSLGHVFVLAPAARIVDEQFVVPYAAEIAGRPHFGRTVGKRDRSACNCYLCNLECTSRYARQGEGNMSTLAYAQLTNKRDAADPGTSTTTGSPGVQSYVDALAALVPAEVLTLHALIISFTTTVKGNTTTIEDPGTLAWSFWGLVGLSVLLYIAPRVLDGKLDLWDGIRSLIPPLAFTAWTMLQRATAFDAVYSTAEAAPRTVAALFLAVLLGGAATALAYQADQKQPPPNQP